MRTDGPIGPTSNYYWVKIEDLSTIASKDQDGADIDAVELLKGTASSWAASVASCTYGDGSACVNADKALGKSDAFCADPTKCFSNVETPTDDPATIPPYVSLGGTVGSTTGTLILKMTDPIENGNQLIVYELGNCTVSAQCSISSTKKATPESVRVSVGTSATGPWTQVLAASDIGKHPDIDITISGLP